MHALLCKDMGSILTFPLILLHHAEHHNQQTIYIFHSFTQDISFHLLPSPLSLSLSLWWSAFAIWSCIWLLWWMGIAWLFGKQHSYWQNHFFRDKLQTECLEKGKRSNKASLTRMHSGITAKCIQHFSKRLWFEKRILLCTTKKMATSIFSTKPKLYTPTIINMSFF